MVDSAYLTEAIKESAKKLYSTMLSLELTTEEAFEGHRELETDDKIVALIGFASAYKGGMAVYFPVEVALKSASAMLGIEVKEVNDDVKDAIGEIVNIVAGGTKTALYKENITFELSLPAVIVGKKYSVYFDAIHKTFPQIVVPFLLEGKRFYVECSLEKEGSEN
ncbi:MAG: chemotaxis protein CheX [Candidatus Omnitrophica bacterium]|nr:chemotaxis protein CheX [Candidatus Omnitrophota bacterium]